MMRPLLITFFASQSGESELAVLWWALVLVSYVNLQLIFLATVRWQGLTAAFYAVLELSIPLRKLSNDIVQHPAQPSAGDSAC